MAHFTLPYQANSWIDPTHVSYSDIHLRCPYSLLLSYRTDDHQREVYTITERVKPISHRHARHDTDSIVLYGLEGGVNWEFQLYKGWATGVDRIF